MNRPLDLRATQPARQPMARSVLHLRSSAGMYGAEHVVLGLMREQALRGIDVSLLAFTHGAPPALLAVARDAGLRAEPLGCRGALDLLCLRVLRERLVSGKVDVLHCHDYKSIVYARIAARGLPIATVATLHGWLDGKARLRVYRWLERRALNGFVRVCAVSAAIEQELRRSGLSADRVRRVDNGIDTERFRPRPRAAVSTTLQLGTAARLSPEKNQLQLLEAIAACRQRGRDVHLTIVGGGDGRAELEAAIEHLQLHGAVRLAGVSDALEGWYPQLDAFVLPSLTEGMPMTVLEAMACGIPVVASAVGAIPTLLQGLSHSRLVPPGDLPALVDALCAQPQLQAPQLDARERVCTAYSLSHMGAEYDAVYSEAMSA